MTVDTSKKTTMYEATKSMVARELFQHNIATPCELVDEMIAVAGKSLTEDAKILVLFNMEFVISLVEDFPWTRPNITLFTNGDEQLERLASRMQISTIESLEKNMKFDLVLGNPPFSDTGTKKQGRGRSKLLYPVFYHWSVNHADTVAMIMPKTDTNRMEEHNGLLRQADNIVDIEQGVFKDVNMPMWTVFSGTGEKKELNIQWSEKLQQKNEIFFKGKLNVGSEKHMLTRDTQKKGDTTIFWKVTKDELVTRYHPAKDMKKTWLLPSTGYCVLLPQAIQKYGWSNTVIVKMDGNQVAGNGMSIAHFKTKKEAQAFVDYMATDHFVEQAVKVRTSLGGMTMGALRSIEIAQ